MPLSTICLPIQAELLGVEELLNSSTASEVDLVKAASQYVLQNGGKRIRPALVLLTAKLLGFSVEKAVPLGAAIEMIHAASLMHDDVLDNATVRRGKQSSNARWGNQISILVGDFLWCKASELSIRHGNSEVLAVITDAVKKTTEGEILEIVQSNDFNLTVEEYLHIIELKTAMLFSCSCEIGAILSGTSEKFRNAFKNYGRHLGTAFQLADDVLDYTANEALFGKKAGQDLYEGKLTLPVIIALKKVLSGEAKIIKDSLLGASPEAGRLKEVISILNKYGAIEEALSFARKYASLAQEELSVFKPSIERDSLIALSNYAVARGQ